VQMGLTPAQAHQLAVGTFVGASELARSSSETPAVLRAALPVRAAVPPLLADAIQKVLADANRWAFTQTIVEENGKGEETKRTVVRYDPSKTYADQYVVLSVDGKPPSESDRSKYRRRGERRGERMEKAESEGRTDTVGSRQSLGELMDLDGATQAAEDRTSVMFEVPLRKEGNKRLPPEKFLVLARVNKTTRAFERVEVKLREPLRAALVVNIKSGEGLIEFKSVDPKFAPTISRLEGTGAYSILFIPGGRSYEVRHADFKRVKPYAERFGVQIGTMQAIDF